LRRALEHEREVKIKLAEEVEALKKNGEMLKQAL
jgi:hypothetical protein